MYKKLLVFFLVFISGCSKINDKDISTFIEENDSYLISINYPITNIRYLDDLITNYTDKIYNDFKNSDDIPDGRKELNIDYKFEVVNDRYYNVLLSTYINNKDKNTDIYSICFDKISSKVMDIYDVIDSNNKISNINKDTPFFFDDRSLTIYKKNKNISFDLDDLNLLIDIKSKNTSSNKFVSTVFKEIDPNKPIVAITFDDGPSKYTKKIIELLNEYEANATFFVLGNKVKLFSETIGFAISSGNEIGNHSYNHKLLTTLSSDEIKEQINDTQNIIYSSVGYKPVLLRPTYGSVNDNIRNSTDLKIVLWNVDTLDWKIKNSKKIANRLIGSVKDRSIILMHDTHERTYKALSIALPELKKKGYQFVTVSELLKFSKDKNE